MTTRRSLRDRNRAAIADDPPLHVPHDVIPEKQPETRGKKKTPKTTGNTRLLGLYLTQEEYTSAKAAYLADWNNGGLLDTFSGWIAAALDTHASRTPKQRSTSTMKERAQARVGSSRSFTVPEASVTRMRKALTDDQKAGRWLSASAWCSEAISWAVDQARTNNGGTLPTPPARLPNRLTR
ncbi:MAG: hypothetical protein Q4D96_09275 [Propionibacteriaceae bacterium]|nr:hypothetical protein [Propionibacteriaceae bacterium]